MLATVALISTYAAMTEIFGNQKDYKGEKI